MTTSLIRIGQFLLNVWEGYILIRSALSVDHKFITKMDKNSDERTQGKNRKIINQMANDKNYLWAETVTERKLQKH